MTQTAIVFREVRAANHAMDLLRLRQLSTRWGVGIVGFLLVLEGFGLPLLRHCGFFLFVIMAAALVTLSANACVGIIADERSGGTLDLLFLAGVKSWELFVGKLLGAVLIVGSVVLGLVPLLAFPFLCSGLSLETFLGMLALLMVLLLAVVGVSVLASTLAREAAGAQTAVIVTGILWTFGLPVLHWMGRLVSGAAPFRERWLALSPFHTAMLLESGLASPNRRSFWFGAAFLAAAGLAAMAAASVPLRHVWKRNLDSAYSPTERRRASTRRNAIADHSSPIEAEMATDWRSLRLHWWVAGISLGLWLLGAVMWGRPWLSPVVALAVSALLATITESLSPMPLVHRVTSLRRDGGLEMLLVAPLSSEEVVDGFVTGTGHLLHRWKQGMAAAVGLILLAGFPVYDWNLGSVTTYLLAGSVLVYWTLSNPAARLYGTFRISVFTGDPRLAHLKQGSWITQVLFGQIWNGIHFYKTLRGLGRLPRFPTGSALELSIAIGVLLVIVIATAASRNQRRKVRLLAIEELHSLASQPLPARKDPRLKKWRMNLPLPES